MKRRFVQIGAGNIGRSLLGDLFADDWALTFVDVDAELVADLNARGGYEIAFRDAGQPERRRRVCGVAAIMATDEVASVTAIAQADMLGVSIGKAAWRHAAPTLAKGLVARNGRPIDLLIAENVPDGRDFARQTLAPHLPDDFDWSTLGLVATCIGRMVPPQPSDLLRQGIVVSESAAEFFVDKTAFVTTPPKTKGLDLVEEIDAYVDRKLYLHNMTHSAVAYLAARQELSATYVAEAVRDPQLRATVARAADQVIAGICRRWPTVFTADDLRAYVDRLLRRYENEALGDTLDRVGRDLPRKLGPHDRILGPIRMLQEFNLPADAMRDVLAAARWFPDPAANGQRIVDQERVDDRKIAEHGSPPAHLANS